MQYVGGSVVGVGMGSLLDHFGWGAWGPSMIGFSLVGGLLMLTLWNARPKAHGGADTSSVAPAADASQASSGH
jgi:OPA family glycerol-3-phosphate transporter-like MFS transporter